MARQVRYSMVLPVPLRTTPTLQALRNLQLTFSVPLFSADDWNGHHWEADFGVSIAYPIKNSEVFLEGLYHRSLTPVYKDFRLNQGGLNMGIRFLLQ